MWTQGPSMAIARSDHGCANVLVGSKSIVFVAGGFNNYANNKLTSVEYLDLNDMESGWKMGKELPMIIRGTQMITSPDKQKAYLVGGRESYSGGHQVLEFFCNSSPENCYFKDMGVRTQVSRTYHVAYLIPDSLAKEYCN